MLLRLAILFGLSAVEEDTKVPLPTDIHQRNALNITHAESPGLSDGLGGR